MQSQRYQYDVARNAEVLVLATEWTRCRQPDFEGSRERWKAPLRLDDRKQYDPDDLTAAVSRCWPKQTVSE